jgi:hypothetical protein
MNIIGIKEIIERLKALRSVLISLCIISENYGTILPYIREYGSYPTIQCLY